MSTILSVNNSDVQASSVDQRGVQSEEGSDRMEILSCSYLGKISEPPDHE